MGFHTSRRRVSHWVAGLIGLATLAAAMSAQSASAQTLTWLGTLDGNWGTVTGGTSNWSNNNVPSTSGTTAILLINGGSNLSALTNNIGGLNLWQAGGFATAQAKVRLEGSTPITLSGSAIRFSGTAASQGVCVNLAGTGTHTFSAPIEANCTTLMFAVSGTKYLTSAISEGYGTNCSEMIIASNATTPANLFLSTVSTATIGTYIQDGGTVTVPGLLSAISPSGITLLRLGSGSTTATVVKTGGAESLASQIRIGSGILATDTGGVSLINNGSGAWTFSNTGTVNQYVGTILANRTLTLGGTNSDSNTISGIITNNRFDGTNFSTTQGVVSLAKIGTGVWVLSGSNSYTGTTSIAAGTLRLGANGSFGSSSTITVGNAGSSGAVLDLTAKTGTFAFTSGQTVGGIGTINIGAGKTVSSAGIWAPGNSIGSNTVTGNLSLSGTSQFELGTPGASTSAPGTSDFTAVSGTLTLGGNLALIDNANAGSQGSYGAGSYRLFTASSLSGTYASVTGPVGATTTRVGMVYTAGTASGQGVFANVYNLASAAASQTVNLGNGRAGTTTGTVTLTNSAPANATYTETLSTGGFSSTSANFTATGSASAIAGGASGSGDLVVGLGSGLAAGAQTGTTTLALFSNAVNSSGLAQQSLAAQTITITGTVYDFAQAKFSGTTLNFGVVHLGASVSGQNVAFGNQTVTSASFQDSLDVSATTGNARVTATGFSGLAASTGGATTNNLAVSVSTATAGSLASTLSLTLTSNANGVAGLSNGTAGTVGGGSITTTGGVFSGTGSWNVDGGGSWGSGASANWTSAESVSAAPGTFAGYTTTDSATFGTALTGGTASILLNGATPSLASIAFANTAGRYVLDQGSGGSLTLATASGKPTVSVVAGALNEIKTAILGTNGLQKTGLGTLVLSGSNAYSGGTDITAGTLAVNGSLVGAVNVASGATLGGAGVLNGLVTVAGGGILAPGNSPGTLTMNSGLALDASSILNFELNATDATIGGGINDLINVTGNFTLAGILNVAGIGDFSTATDNTKWRLFNYSGGTFTGGLTLGSMPSVGSTGKTFQIDTATPGQVNLVIVPEPGAVVLAAIGVGLVGWAARRRRA